MTKRIPLVMLLFTVVTAAVSADAQEISRRRAAAQSSHNYLPLAVGNSWSYAASGAILQESFTVQVLAEQEFNGNRYFQLLGFIGESASDPQPLDLSQAPWVRLTESGQLVEWDLRGGSERLWYEFQAPEGASWTPQLPDECVGAATMVSRRSSVAAPAGTFSPALRIEYSPANCADAGFERELFAADVGLVERTIVTIAGPRSFVLTAAQINGKRITAPSLSLSLAIDRPTYRAYLMPPVDPERGIPRLNAALTIRNTGDLPLTLTFPSGQQFDFEIRNERGEAVYRWSDGKFFTLALTQLDLSPGEQTFAVEIPLSNKPGEAFAPGEYTLEGWLTTIGAAAYRASVGFEILEPLF